MFNCELSEMKAKVFSARKRKKAREEARKRLEAEELYAAATEHKVEIYDRIQGHAEAERFHLHLSKVFVYLLCAASAILLSISLGLPQVRAQVAANLGAESHVAQDSGDFQAMEDFVMRALHGDFRAGSYHERIWSRGACEREVERGSGLLEYLKGSPFKLSLRMERESGLYLAFCDFGNKGRHCLLLERKPPEAAPKLLCIDFEE